MFLEYYTRTTVFHLVDGIDKKSVDKYIDAKNRVTKAKLDKTIVGKSKLVAYDEQVVGEDIVIVQVLRYWKLQRWLKVLF